LVEFIKKILIALGLLGNILSPLGKGGKILQNHEYTMAAFLPSWEIKNYKNIPKGLDEIVYWDVGDKKISDNFRGKRILGIKTMVEREKLKEMVKGYDGVNVDVEYNDDPVAVLNDEFVNYLTSLKGMGTISVDVFVNTINKGDKDRLQKLFAAVDEVVIMAYDFHRPGMDESGPIAPLMVPVGERSIVEVVERIVNLGLDRSKVVMAYPLYGYEWKTESADYRAEIVGDWYQVVSIKRAKQFQKEKNLVEKWDEQAASPWMSYEENGQNYNMYYENERSLKIKLDVVKQNKLKGVSFWALGYEDSGDLFGRL